MKTSEELAETAVQGDEADQFHRSRLMLGDEGVARLRSATVMVVGLGAVGSYAVEALARAGVGRFRLVDFDEVQTSNINRQLFATHETVGRWKTDVAKERVLAINPDARVETRRTLVNAETVDALFEGEWQDAPDYLVDAIDTLGPKVALVAAAVRRKLAFMSSMGAALRFDASLVRAGRLTNVSNCPLSAQLRKRLRRVGINTDDVPCVFSPEPIREALRAGDDRLERVTPAPPMQSADDRSPQGRPRNTLGSLPTIVGLFGLTIAHEAILSLSGARGRS